MYRSPYDQRGFFLAAPFLGGLLGGLLGGALFYPRPFYPPIAPFPYPYAPFSPFPGGGFGYPYI